MFEEVGDIRNLVCKLLTSGICIERKDKVGRTDQIERTDLDRGTELADGGRETEERTQGESEMDNSTGVGSEVDIEESGIPPKKRTNVIMADLGANEVGRARWTMGLSAEII